MASPGGSIMPPEMSVKLFFSGIGTVLCIAIGLSRLAARHNPKNPSSSGDELSSSPGLLRSFLLFFYSCFLKPHQTDGDGGKVTQQEALESFYKKQASVYDVTRNVLLKGREDMLALVAAQVTHKAERQGNRFNGGGQKRIWVDIGGGTGWNIEAMNAFVRVPEFFSSVYLVDFSPSLCEVATRRFQRLGWTNVKVICQDARQFRLEDYENGPRGGASNGADLITMSYSLSMIPDFYSVIDSLTTLLAPDGIMGVIDFYVQSEVDCHFRNYTGGLAGRHTSFLSRAFWRSWFDLDRVSLEPARRDYVEYQFGTILSVNMRNRVLGSIPYYIWVGCSKEAWRLPGTSPVAATTSNMHGRSQARLPLSHVQEDAHPKALEVVASNRSANLPLPSFFYQNQPWRQYYDDQLQKHKQFNDEYIYAFTWEDSRVDEQILKLTSNDVVLAITSAGDNILSYALQCPARIHAVDLNPAQNHLLELKVAAYSARLSYGDFWRIFGEGKHEDFRSLLVSRLSPHLSSRAFQHWLGAAHVFSSKGEGGGLYDTGGSKHAIRVFRWVSRAFGCRRAVRRLLDPKTTLNEQREIWQAHIRPALLSKLVSGFVVSQEQFLWTALGVPRNQLAMIEADHAAAVSSASIMGPSEGEGEGKGEEEKKGRNGKMKQDAKSSTRSAAIWQFMADTLDPVVEETHISRDNPYYYVCLAGKFSRDCHPDYLSRSAHSRLSRAGAFDGLRIHTDELEVVLAGLQPGTLTVAVVMDSMDWFDPGDPSTARSQISRLNRALKVGGRVMLRSAALAPWYVKEFAALGFSPKRVGARTAAAAAGAARRIDRVNMYASCWVLHKVGNLPPPTPLMEGYGGSGLEVDGAVVL